MKTVFNTSEVAHIWATGQQSNGRNSQGNFYFSHGTIYSYGGHFPIATINGNDVLFTLRSYSNITAKHINDARSAVSHMNIIYCFDVPVRYSEGNDIKQGHTSDHEKNITAWKNNIKGLFNQLGNRKIRNTESRINEIQRNIDQLNTYCKYFKYTVKDKELKDLLKLVMSDNFLTVAREAKDKQNAAAEKKMQQATKAHEKYIALWRDYKDDEIRELPAKTKDLANFYANNTASYTRLRFNREQNRLETSKGIQIPADIAKRAFIQLNGCMEGTCKDISVPVINYTITETTKDYIKAGCHTIPKSDVQYIANLLKW